MTPQVSVLQPATRERLAMMQHYFEIHGMNDPVAAQHQAVIAIGHTIQAQAYYFAMAMRSGCWLWDDRGHDGSVLLTKNSWFCCRT